MRLVLFGGNGRVGKTTCCSAAAVQVAQAGSPTLLVSTDPGHSLSDCLEQEIGPEVQKLKGVNNLWALEISTERLFLKYEEDHADEIKRTLETGTYREEDVDELFSMSLPGLDEMMALKGLVELMDHEEHDFCFLDAAPTRHALRLLAVPQLLDEWIKALARSPYEYRYVVSRLDRREIHEPDDDFLFTMKQTVQRIQALLRDPDRCEFVVVTIPEVMAVAETRRLVDDLARLKVPVGHLILNRVVPSDSECCPFCRERRRGQQGPLREIRQSFSELTSFELLERPHHVKGITRLKEFQLPVKWLRADPVLATGRGIA